MRMFIVAGLALSLAACGGNTTATEANTVAADNMMMDGAAMNDMSTMDMNMDAGMTNDANAQLMMEDLNTNDPDTNLSNGL